MGPGRGSGAGSLVAYCLDITDLDPIEFDLIFERFLNPDRVSMPDFDIDFCEDKRDQVFEYLKTKYKNGVAHIITFGKLKARMVLRDVGRVLGFLMVTLIEFVKWSCLTHLDHSHSKSLLIENQDLKKKLKTILKLKNF